LSHRAPPGRGVAEARSEIKIVFAVKDVRKFTAERAAFGLKFGVIHQTGAHEFANARDPAGNSIQVSSRGLK
jgi:hypothetical protein